MLWLSDHGLLDDLVERLDPYLDSEEHSIAQQCICEIIRMSQTSLVESPSIGVNELITQLKSERVMKKLVSYMLDPNAPNSTSTLINGVTIIIDLIRHNNSDMDNDPMLNGVYGYQANTVASHPSVSLADMLRVLADRVSDFNNLLLNPKSVTGPASTTVGERTPLGFERLKICELFAELLHCSNMSNLNTVLAEQSEKKESENNVQDIHTNLSGDVTDNNTAKSANGEEDTINQHQSASNQDHSTTLPFKLNEDKILETKNSNCSNSAKKERSLPVGDYLKVKFVQFKVMPTCIDLFFGFPWNNFLHYVIYDMLHQVFNGRMDKGYNRNLAISIFKDGHLTDKMVEIQRLNDDECSKPKGMRLGCMGHLTFIADEVIKLLEGYPESIASEIKMDVDLERWNGYCNNELKETKERDRLPLGGARPSEGMEAEISDDEENEDVLNSTAAAQYSRYLVRRGADGTIDDEEGEEEGDNWISGSEAYSHDYDYDRGFTMDSRGGNNNDHIPAEHEIHNEEYLSDEEEEDVGEVTDWPRGFSHFPHASMLQRTESRVHEKDDNLGDKSEGKYPAGPTELGKHDESLQKTIIKTSSDDDPFGDFAGSNDTLDETQWTSFTDKFDGIQVTEISAANGAVGDPTDNPQTGSLESKGNGESRLQEKNRTA
ncbi:hypothetical protein EC973_008177 [Apophysomyces ossiformis]|uniref:Extragenic suppressor of kinetochore protein 1 n=1 Tax=Apophysomyces ossiformis TaxID=679940 RepID=A0A8H7BQX2_9FUNG|nr:hypothetical protein EC973_008177 [Apophysomyces ossiformis]